ncbi:dTMP kinase [Helicobacter sp. 11S03491-1]|uniref:dTMP kinase n=1 Tax=Helicobacter sp. 11S03491-1 TaxID=1476196 RepID=UPI000BA67DF7|nr:dTMP kinase [Helicobacter sp. 11S03491-1]PAF41341.1 dTMP kinase [Helicobacter sp. 11S03491-1]
MYIALEGIDTCGKSTQLSLLKACYPQAIFTKEPGGSPIGAQIREIILKENNPENINNKKKSHLTSVQNATKSYHMDSKTEFLLFLADRAEHTAKVLIPNQGKLILSDRSIISGIAYAQQIPKAKEFNLFATDHIVPDLVIMLKINTSTLQSRLEKKSNDSIELRGIDYLLDIQKNIEQVTNELKSKLVVIDASLPPECIHTQIIKAIEKML